MHVGRAGCVAAGGVRRGQADALVLQIDLEE
jgi:hypothetical protein